MRSTREEQKQAALLKRYHRRLAKEVFWARPLKTRRDRLRAWINMIFSDHGIFRLVYPNYHWLSPRAARAAQPSPGLIRRFAREGGRTVVSLRGGSAFGSLPLEIEACDISGLTYRQITVTSRAVPTRETFADLVTLMRSVDTPVLYHCKSGADRAGFVSVLQMHLVEGLPIESALDQLSIRYGHVKSAKTGVLDRFFEAYIADSREQPQTLEEWVANRYDPEVVTASFRPRLSWAWFVDKVLRRE